MLFVRDFRGYTGGHQKVFDYFCHASAYEGLSPKIHITPGSLRDESNPWRRAGIAEASPNAADCYFVAGLDWRILDNAGIDLTGGRVINLLQGLRHASPKDPRFSFLGRPAIRLCVSEEVSDAVRATGAANGPVITVPIGIEQSALLPLWSAAKRTDVFIAGLKNVPIARQIERALRRNRLSIDLSATPIPRDEFTARLAAAKVAVLLPEATEGFFLPPLESMLVGTAVIVPDCIGNRGLCRDGATCLAPPYDAAELTAAARWLIGEVPTRHRLIEEGRRHAARYALSTERKRFHDVLREALRQWQ